MVAHKNKDSLMFSLTISFGPASTAWAYLFKDEEKARHIYNEYVNYKVGGGIGGTLIGADDFGQAFAIPFSDIHGVQFEDLDQIKQARIERSLVDAQAQALFNQRASTDPVVRQAMQQRGAPILQPMPGGFRN
jgi:hypothetical protein